MTALVKAPALALVATFAISASCAPTAKAPKGTEPAPATIETTEAVAFEAERQINAAEKELQALNPDPAVKHLDAAERLLADPRIKSYPDAKPLRDRHLELTASIPKVREDVRKREIARAVEAARSKIDAGRASLKEAIGRIQKKAPEESDLKSAEEAVESVRAALDEASKLESQDVEYAKFALSVSKELPTQKKLVEQRRLEVSVDGTKQEIGRAVTNLTGLLTRIKAKDVAQEDFDRARAAADEVQAAVAKADPLITKDVAFAKHVAGVREKLAAHRQSIEQRQQDVTVQRHRGKIDEAKRAMTGSLSKLSGNDVADSEFVAAEAAVKDVTKLLEEGNGFVGKNKDYGSYAANIKKAADEATAKIATRKTDVTIRRKKAEIEAAKTALAGAVKTMNEPNPTEGMFGASSEAATALEKLLESAEPLSGKDAKFAASITDARKSIVAARVAIDKRKLGVEIERQRAKVDEALAGLKQSTERLDTPEDFKAAEKAAGDVEKALDAGESFGPKDADYSKYATEARKTAAAARKRIGERREDVSIQQYTGKIDVALEGVNRALAGLEGGPASEPAFKAVAEAIAAAKKALDEGSSLEAKMPKYASYALRAQKTLADAQAKLDKRKLDMSVGERRGLIEGAVAAAKTKAEAAQALEATGEVVKEAVAAITAAREEITKAAALEKTDKSFETFIASSKKELDKMHKEIELAKHSVAFREKPIAELAGGLSLVDSAVVLPAADQHKAFASALEQFKNCQKDGGSILAEAPALASTTFQIGRKKVTASAILSACADHAKSTETKLAAVKGTVAFYEGPAKAWTKAKEASAKAASAGDGEAKKKANAEALASYEECVGSGRLLEHQHPELKKEQFDVDGKKVTLAAVVEACQKEAKSLRAGQQGAK